MLLRCCWYTRKISTASSLFLGPPAKSFSAAAGSFGKQQKIRVNGVDLSYVKGGEGEHAILCIPGALGTALSDLPRQIEFFSGAGDNNISSQFTIIGFDPRGYGNSRPPSREFSISPVHFLKQDALDGHSLMTSLGFDKFSILGWSDGGVSALLLAGIFPQSVRKLVTWGGNAFVCEEDIKIFEQIRDVSSWSKKKIDGMTAMYGADFQPMWSAWTDSMLELCRRDGNLCRNEIKNIQCPSLILHGDRDPLVPLYHPVYLHENTPGSRLERYPQGRHGIHFSYSEDLNRKVMRFLLE